ncbi:hypothetical protein B0H13DRAFT_2311321 [Mycena leptocephala]|nr:hypothetical protein B0H13DRAFT_2311321 [Mycena leptocephala]
MSSPKSFRPHPRDLPPDDADPIVACRGLAPILNVRVAGGTQGSHSANTLRSDDTCPRPCGGTPPACRSRTASPPDEQTEVLVLSYGRRHAPNFVHPRDLPPDDAGPIDAGAMPPAPVPAAELLTPAEPEPEHLPMSRQKSLRSRLGGAMRRTSSILAISRPTTPTPSTPVEDSRRSSISEPQEIPKSATSLTPSGATPPAPVPTAALLPPAEPVPEPVSEEPTPAPQANGAAHEAIKRLLPIGAQYQQYPSPIATSPARDADVFTEDVNTTPALSALEQVSEIIPAVEQDAPAPPDEAEPAPVHAAEAEEAAEPASAPTEHDTYVPPPPMLHSSNPGAFADEPEEILIPCPCIPLLSPQPPPRTPGALYPPGPGLVLQTLDL